MKHWITALCLVASTAVAIDIRTLMLMADAAPPAAEATPYPNGYGYRIPVYVSPDVIQDSSDLTNFPVLVYTTNAALAGQSYGGKIQNTNGFDLTFTDADGTTALDFEVEKYGVGTGELIAWVRIPLLHGSLTTTNYLYYGNPTVSVSAANAHGVWDTNYMAVWHCNTYEDSTSHTNQATPFGAKLAVTNYARIGDTLAFGMSPDYLRFYNSESLRVHSGPTMTLEFWYNCTNVANACNSISFAGDGGYRWRLNTDLSQRWTVNDAGDAGFDICTGQTFAVQGTWNWAAAACQLGAENWIGVYAKGALVNTNTAAAVGSIRNVADYTYLGAFNTGAFQSWAGWLDEMRISDIRRSDLWMYAVYTNQVDPAGTVTYGAQETP